MQKRNWNPAAVDYIENWCADLKFTLIQLFVESGANDRSAMLFAQGLPLLEQCGDEAWKTRAAAVALPIVTTDPDNMTSAQARIVVKRVARMRREVNPLHMALLAYIAVPVMGIFFPATHFRMLVHVE